MLKMIKSWAVWCVECAALLLLSMLLTTLYLLRAPVGWLSRACSRDRRDAGGTRVPQFGQTEDAAQAIVVMAGSNARAAATTLAEQIRQRLGITVNKPGEKAIHAIILTLTTDMGPTQAMRLAGTNFHSMTKFKPHVAAALSLFATASVAGLSASATAAVSAITIPIIAAPVVKSLANVANIRLHSERAEASRTIRTWAADVLTDAAWVTRTTAEVAYDQPPPNETGESKRKREHREHERSVRALRQLDPAATESFRAKDRARKSAAKVKHISAIAVEELGARYPPQQISDQGVLDAHLRADSRHYAAAPRVGHGYTWIVSDSHFVGEHVRISSTSGSGVILAMFADSSLLVSVYTEDQLNQSHEALIEARSYTHMLLTQPPATSLAEVRENSTSRASMFVWYPNRSQSSNNSLIVFKHSPLAAMNEVLLACSSENSSGAHIKRFYLADIVPQTTFEGQMGKGDLECFGKQLMANNASISSMFAAAHKLELYVRRENKKRELQSLNRYKLRAYRIAARSNIPLDRARNARKAFVHQAIRERSAVQLARRAGNACGGHWCHEDSCQCQTCKLLRRLRTMNSLTTQSLAMLYREGVHTEATEKAALAIEEAATSTDIDMTKPQTGTAAACDDLSDDLSDDDRRSFDITPFSSGDEYDDLC